jgi:hypothetical protein
MFPRQGPLVFDHCFPPKSRERGEFVQAESLSFACTGCSYNNNVLVGACNITPLFIVLRSRSKESRDSKIISIPAHVEFRFSARSQPN